MVASRQLLLLLKNKTANTQGKKRRPQRAGRHELVVYVNVRIGLTLYGISCSICYELNSFFGGGKKMPVSFLNGREDMFRKDTIYKKGPSDDKSV
jgi:hypothetical protein